MTQKVRHSLMETICSTIFGYFIGLGAQMLVFPMFGFNVTLGQDIWIVTIFTGISLVRGYVFRRLFNHFTG